ncbi:MAG: stage V sporulation protein B [Gracilibacteraceae bacterium]|nr:stage V sporulation protein B [Gracilibacteraceae bacterium]
MKKLTYIQGAFILTMTNLITGSLSFIYRVFLTRAIGSEGIGVYQLILPLYMLFITLVSGGITTAVSKLIAEQAPRSNYRNMYKIIQICCITIGMWSLALCTLIFFNAEYLAKFVLKDSRTFLSIMVFTPAIFFISIGAVLKGYFYGLQYVKPPALIDILEKLIRLGGLVLTTYFLLPYGIEYVCGGVMTAMAAGELISLVLLYFCYRANRPAAAFAQTDSTIHIIMKILKTALPLSLSGALTTIMDMITAVLIPMQLRAAGFSNSNALSLYGQVTGMVMPLLFFPFIIVSSLGITLVPAIAASYATGNWTALNKKCNDSLKITSAIAFASTALFIVFPWELCKIFFKCPEAGSMLFWMSFVCPFEYWQFTLFAILNGVGRQHVVLKNSILHIAISVICSYFLIPIPFIGIYGFVIGFCASAVLICVWNLADLKRIPNINIDYANIFLKPLFAFIGMFIIIKCCNLYLTAKAAESFNMTVSSIAGLIFFFLVLLLTGTFTPRQLKNTLFSHKSRVTGH